MKHRLKILLRVCAFSLIFLLLFAALGEFFRPLWYDNMVHSFYDQPENSIESVFLGASIVSAGVNPAALYRDYGISAFNLGSAKQPMLETYYWLEETYRLHPESLKTVFLDASSLRTYDESRSGQMISQMKLSPVKLRAHIDQYGKNPKELFNRLNPFVANHDRWDALSVADFHKATRDRNNGARGHNDAEGLVFQADYVAADALRVKSLVLDRSAEPAALNERSLQYFDKMVAFCREKGLKLILFKTPSGNWSSSLSLAAEQVAKDNDLPYLDYNFYPLAEDLNYCYAYDSLDDTHLNYYGAYHLTQKLGRYLAEECDATDFRGKEGYEHLEAELKEYELRSVQKVALAESTTAAEFIEKASVAGNTVFITVNDSASAALNESLRKQFAELGLAELAKIENTDSYLAVIENGEVIHEARQSGAEKELSPLLYHGKTQDGSQFDLKSGGYYHGLTSSCKIRHSEKNLNNRGINIVVYNNEIGDTVFADCFDTHQYAARQTYTLDTVAEIMASPETSYPSWHLKEKVRQYLLKVKQQEAADLKKQG